MRCSFCFSVRISQGTMQQTSNQLRKDNTESARFHRVSLCVTTIAADASLRPLLELLFFFFSISFFSCPARPMPQELPQTQSPFCTPIQAVGPCRAGILQVKSWSQMVTVQHFYTCLGLPLPSQPLLVHCVSSAPGVPAFFFLSSELSSDESLPAFFLSSATDVLTFFCKASVDTFTFTQH